MKRAIIYARVSGDDSNNEGRNLEGQLQMGREHCAKRGHRIAGELAEDVKGASGAEIDLPQLNKVREMATERSFDVLVVRELDRLSRNLGKQLVLEEELKRCGVTIEYVLYDYPDTPEGSLMKNIRAAFSEYERDKITERNVRGRRLKVKGGSVLCYGRASYGYRVEKKAGNYILLVHKQEAKIVRLVFQWWVEERLSMHEMVRRLNSMGVPLYQKPVGVKGAHEWTHTTVRCILSNETYAGVWYFGKRDRHGKARPHEQWLSVSVPPILSREKFDLSKKLLDANKERRAHSTKHEHLLARRVKCSRCNVNMAALATSQTTNGKRYLFRYYICKHTRKGGNLHSVNAKKADAAVWSWLKRKMADLENLREGVDDYNARQELVVAPLRHQLDVSNDLLADKRHAYGEILDLYLTTKIRKDVLDAKAQSLDAEIEGLVRTQKELEERIKAAILTTSQVVGIERIAKQVSQRMDFAAKDFAKRRWLVETLNVSVQVRWEGKEKLLDARCIIGQEVLALSDATTRPCASQKAPAPVVCGLRLCYNHRRGETVSDAQISIAPFLGIWALDPTQSEYQLGTPPQRGTYQLVPDGEQIAVAMDWTDAAGKDFHMVYYMTPDGQDHPYPDSPAVDAIQSTLLDARTLETLSKQDGKIVASGLRELADDGKTMRVIQTGKLPDGSTFQNIAVYLKQR